MVVHLTPQYTELTNCDCMASMTSMDAKLGPVVQSVVTLNCSLVVKMLTVLVSTVSKSHVFLLKNVSSFCKCKSYSHFFSKNISTYAIFNDQSFNDTLTNDIVSFEQLGPGFVARVLAKNGVLTTIEIKEKCGTVNH